MDLYVYFLIADTLLIFYELNMKKQRIQLCGEDDENHL